MEAVRQVQQVTGELLWLSQRSRPASCAARRAGPWATCNGQSRPCCVCSRQHPVHCWSDASFLPEGSRSHSGWCVCLRGCPIAWRSARQAFVSLSKAESELLASLECAVALDIQVREPR